VAREPIDAARVRKLLVQVTIAAAVWAALLLAGAVWWAGGTFLQALGRIGPGLWIATVAALAANLLARFARWHWMLAAEGHHPPLPRSLAIFLAGLALEPTPAKAGVAVRSLLLVDEGVPVNVSLAAYFSERLFDLLGLIMLAALVLSTGSEHRWWLALAGGVAAVIGVRIGPTVARAVHARVMAPRPRAALAWLIQFLDRGAELVAGRYFLPFLALGLIANVATGTLLWFALTQFAAPIPLEIALGSAGVAHLSGSLSLLPGGLGGFELAMLAHLSLVGVPAATALVAVALVRLATVWGSVAVGLPMLAISLRKSSAG
jgi:uncharacterized membrane protein YbhN (UPF0104 family)